MFPRSELLHRILIRRKRGKMIAAESLTATDFPGSQQFGGFANRVSRLRDSISRSIPDARSDRTLGNILAPRGTDDSEASRYSRAQSAHIGNSAIVVHERSYGTPRTTVNRGPQLVQLVKG